MADCEQCYYQEIYGQNDNVGTAKSHQQNVKFVLLHNNIIISNLNNVNVYIICRVLCN